jgi:arginyl-tRNA synthetase
MIRDALQSALVDAVRGLGVDGEMPDLELSRTRSPELGDYATSAPQKLARVLRQAPDAIAARLAQSIAVPDGAATAEAVRGYVNFRLTERWLQQLVARVEPRYGARDLGRGERVQVEFLSVNPTGPLHIGHGRGAILGDSIARLLEFTGHLAQREYYVNDQNRQARLFGESVFARMHGQEPPDGGYFGDYVIEIAEKAKLQRPQIVDRPDDVRAFAIGEMVDRIRATVVRLDVRYDEWFFESKLWTEKLPDEAIDRLRARGYLKEKEGALWFGDPEESEEEDRVVRKSDGEPTYFASDLGYLLSRFEKRGFERVIEVWGADHHGYVPRMKAAAAALGIDAQKLVIILNQLVSLKEEGAAAGTGSKMSKRAGRFVTLDQLIDRVGADAVRYFYLRRSPDTAIEFDIELALRQGSENPLYYAQYAHARLSNVEVTARERHSGLPDRADVSVLTRPWELDVARQLAFWPDTVEDATRLLEPHRIPYYVQDLATAVHRFYHAGNAEPEHRVVVDDPILTRARLELCRAARHTLKTALDLIGVSAPERM